MDWKSLFVFFFRSAAIESSTRFEDLSNEIIYEIFEYLDFFYLYQIFSNLNSRYHDLIRHSTVPIKLILSPMSYRTFQNFSKDFLITYQHRIHSIHSTNPFLFDLSPSPFRYLFQFYQLQTLLLEQFDSKHLKTLLSQLALLPRLMCLTVKPLNAIAQQDHVYRQIFRLPALIYCQVFSSSEPGIRQSLSIHRSQYTRIEHLIMSHPCSLGDLLLILTYVPQLRRLSCQITQQPIISQQHFPSIVLSQWTHLSFKFITAPFTELEMFFTKISHEIQVFRLSLDLDFDIGYADAQRWETFILIHLPKLRLFDPRFCVNNRNNLPYPAVFINRFTTSFWQQRQWFFRYEYDHSSGEFYSIEPYR